MAKKREEEFAAAAAAALKKAQVERKKEDEQGEKTATETQSLTETLSLIESLPPSQAREELSQTFEDLKKEAVEKRQQEAAAASVYSTRTPQQRMSRGEVLVVAVSALAAVSLLMLALEPA
jgi:hypothetical protein